MTRYEADPTTPYLVQTSGICGVVRRIEGVFEAGPLWEEASAYHDTAKGCLRETLPPELYNLIRVGAPVDPSVLPESSDTSCNRANESLLAPVTDSAPRLASEFLRSS